MAEQIPFFLALLVITGMIVILGFAELAVFYLISTRTPNRYLRAAAPAAIILLGISSEMNYNPGSVVATSALIAAPVAVVIPPLFFAGFAIAGEKTALRRIIACYTIVSLLAAGFAVYVVLSGLAMVPWIGSLTPVTNAGVYIVAVAVDLLLAAGVYKGMERVGGFRGGAEDRDGMPVPAGQD